MNPSARIREIADLAGNVQVRERLEALAAEFEHQHNDQNNTFSIVIGQLQVKFQDALDAFRKDMARAFGDNEERQKKILEMMEELQHDLRTLSNEYSGDAE